MADNVELVRKGYEAFGKGELDLVRQMWAPDCVWRTPGYGQLRAEYRGIDEVIGYLVSLGTLTGGSFSSEPELMLAGDDRVVSLDHITGTRNGRVLDTHVMHVFRIRAGKVVEATDFASDPLRNAEFWS